MKFYFTCMKRLGWRIGLWHDNFSKRYCKSYSLSNSNDVTDLSSAEYYY